MKIKLISKLIYWLFVFFFVLCVTEPNALAQRRSHTVFYEGEENELHVYRIYGLEEGKTLLILGGIQGDEAAGFLAADLYADFSLKKGNLIVVPRANFPSILKRERKINEDMNRKFMDEHVTNYETRVVKVLKMLTRESDCVLNLHEGSGVYSEKWESPRRNPRRYGQSIISDAAVFSDKKTGVHLDLRYMAEKVIKEINTHITDRDFFFHFNNHRTAEPDSIHKEQRGSATYYALYNCQIPSFGIESCKSLPLEQKVKQHIYAINAFMDIMGIEPETPGVNLKKPELQYMIISVNGSVPVVVGKMQHLKINRGDSIELLDIVANYSRGLSADIVGVGSDFNDMRKKYVITEPTRIEAKKDFYSCGSIFLDFGDKGKAVDEHLKVSDSVRAVPLRYKIKVNHKTVVADNYSHIEIKRGDTLVVQDIITGDTDPSEYVVNFKGFVGNAANNTGEDRGYIIDTGKDVLMKRYSTGNQGMHYYILTTLDEKEKGKLFIDFQQ